MTAGMSKDGRVGAGMSAVLGGRRSANIIQASDQLATWSAERLRGAGSELHLHGHRNPCAHRAVAGLDRWERELGGYWRRDIDHLQLHPRLNGCRQRGVDIAAAPMTANGTFTARKCSAIAAIRSCMEALVQTGAVSPAGLPWSTENSNRLGTIDPEVAYVVGDRPVAHGERRGKKIPGAHLTGATPLLALGLLDQA
jgi:hypothetical protein